MRVAIVSSRFPCGNHEPYLGAELGALRPLVEYLAVAPLRAGRGDLQDPSGAAVMLQRPWNLSTVALACLTFLRSPAATIAALMTVVTSPRAIRAKLKNLATFTTALALAERFRREGIEHVHGYWLSAPATAALVIARVNGISWSATAHRWDIFEYNMIEEKARSAVFIRAISHRGRAELLRRAPASAEKFAIVRLGTALTQKRPPLLRGGKAIELLCAAAFVPTKGHEDLLEAFAAAYRSDGSLRLTLAGEGPLGRRLRERAAALPCADAIEFRGYVAHKQLIRELASGRYAAVVLASRDDGVSDMEGVPSILIEASSLGVPCVATSSGGVGELLDTRSAFLAQPQDPQSLRQAILAVTDLRERTLRAKWAYERSHQLHSPKRTAGEFIALLSLARRAYS